MFVWFFFLRIFFSGQLIGLNCCWTSAAVNECSFGFNFAFHFKMEHTLSVCSKIDACQCGMYLFVCDVSGKNQFLVLWTALNQKFQVYNSRFSCAWLAVVAIVTNKQCLVDEFVHIHWHVFRNPSPSFKNALFMGLLVKLLILFSSLSLSELYSFSYTVSCLLLPGQKIPIRLVWMPHYISSVNREQLFRNVFTRVGNYVTFSEIWEYKLF